MFDQVDLSKNFYFSWVNGVASSLTPQILV